MVQPRVDRVHHIGSFTAKKLVIFIDLFFILKRGGGGVRPDH